MQGVFKRNKWHRVKNNYIICKQYDFTRKEIVSYIIISGNLRVLFVILIRILSKVAEYKLNEQMNHGNNISKEYYL